MSFLVFRETDSEGLKTRRWYVENKSGTILGYISWYAPWRRYCFTTPVKQLVFDACCLTEIQEFLAVQMEARKVKS